MAPGTPEPGPGLRRPSAQLQAQIDTLEAKAAKAGGRGDAKAAREAMPARRRNRRAAQGQRAVDDFS